MPLYNPTDDPDVSETESYLNDQVPWYRKTYMP
jgi:hypothetical protein